MNEQRKQKLRRAAQARCPGVTIATNPCATGGDSGLDSPFDQRKQLRVMAGRSPCESGASISCYFYIGGFVASLCRFLFSAKCFFQSGMNLAQFPENQNEQNCHYEQQELGHFINLLGIQPKTIGSDRAFYYPSAPFGQLQLSSSSSSIHGNVGEACNRNGHEHIGPQFDSTSQERNRY